MTENKTNEPITCDKKGCHHTGIEDMFIIEGTGLKLCQECIGILKREKGRYVKSKKVLEFANQHKIHEKMLDLYKDTQDMEPMFEKDSNE